MFQKLLCFLGCHKYINNPTSCLYCGNVPTCPKHGATLYVHGWYDDVDCLNCQKENKL